MSLCSMISNSRFIPTGVGNMRASVRAVSANSVHPHGRGEHASSKTMLEQDVIYHPKIYQSIWPVFGQEFHQGKAVEFGGVAAVCSGGEEGKA